MSHWFRVYSTMVDDPKFIKLGDDLRSALIMMWCVTSGNDGKLPDLEDIAIKFRMSPHKTQVLLTELERRGWIDRTETGIAPHNWNGRQYKSDLSTDRVKRSRERKRPVPETADETATQRFSSGDATANETAEPRSMKRFPSVSVSSSLPSSATTLESKETQKEQACGQNRSDFDQFWQLYPHKVGKKSAYKAFAIARKAVPFQTLILALTDYIGKTDDRPWCNPATWLNQGRWDDEPAQPVHGGALAALERIQRGLESDADREAGADTFVSLPARQAG